MSLFSLLLQRLTSGDTNYNFTVSLTLYPHFSPLPYIAVFFNVLNISPVLRNGYERILFVALIEKKTLQKLWCVIMLFLFAFIELITFLVIGRLKKYFVANSGVFYCGL